MLHLAPGEASWRTNSRDKQSGATSAKLVGTFSSKKSKALADRGSASVPEGCLCERFHRHQPLVYVGQTNSQLMVDKLFKTAQAPLIEPLNSLFIVIFLLKMLSAIKTLLWVQLFHSLKCKSFDMCISALFIRCIFLRFGGR